MNPALSAAASGGRPRDLWALGVVLILLVVNPALISVQALVTVTAGTAEGPVLTIVDELFGGMQYTTLVIMVGLTLMAFRRLAPVLWSLFLSSLPGMLIAAEMASIFWLVSGGLAGIGMPGLFWSPDAWTMLRTSLGVTLFVYWMLYLPSSTTSRRTVHLSELQVWHRFRPVLEASGLPALLGRPLGDNSWSTIFAWFLTVREPAGSGGAGDPGGLARGTARNEPGGRRVAVARRNGAGHRLDRGDCQ